MRAARSVRLMLGVLLAALAACDREPDRGGAGESCTRRDDCADGLLCLAQVCTPARDADAGADAGRLALAGEACRARSDCAEGLVCTENECAPASAGVEPGNRYSGSGESCRAKSDCVPDLACVMGSCRDVNVGIGHTPKGCYQVECAEDADCCADFMPPANCDVYRQNCETDPIFCNAYRSLCECSKRCEDEQCVVSAPGCKDAGECTSQQTPYCVEGRCAQCDRDSSCPGVGTKCVDGVCMPACSIDENCPLLHACEDSVCVEVGCRSDRECVFVTNDPLAECRDTRCEVPCDADADCVNDQERFQVCVDGECLFVGCEEDFECRAFLMLQGRPGKTHAVCR